MSGEQLTKYRTQLDRQANYNRKGLFQGQLQVYQEEIVLSKTIQKKQASQFTLEPLQVGFVQSLTLKDDPKFISIQKTFEKYNEQVKTMKSNPQAGMHLKKVVMQSMLKFMRVMLLAPGIESKKTILDLSYFWFIKHLNPKSVRKSGQQLNNQIRQIVTQHQLVPQSIFEKQLPSSKLAADLREYRRGARTKHQDIDAPDSELHNYQVHKVTYMGQSPEAPETEAERWKKKLLTVKYPKPNLDQYEQEEEAKQEDKIQIPILQPTDQVDIPKEEKAEEAAPVQQQQGQNVPQNAELAKQMQLLNQMGEDPDEPEEVVVEQEEDKKRGKLDPLVKVFMRKQLQQQQKVGNFQHPPINQLQRYRNNYKEAVQREDQQFYRNMNSWAAKRSRFKTQIARKVQSIRINPSKAADTTFDHSFSQTRVSQAIRDGRKYVKGELSKERLNTEGGLSCFDKRRVKTVAASNNKTFSNVLEENRRANQREQGLTQIQRIKHKFAKHKIFTSMQAMKGGLMQHQDEEEERTKVEYPVCLMSNPFFVSKKKKKKKGKKGR